MPFESHPSTGIRKYPAAIALATISLVAGVYMHIKGPVTGLAPAGATVLRVSTGSGAQRGIVDDKGQAAFSGSIRTETGFSGSTLQVDSLGAAAAGSVLCKKAGGLVGYRTVSATGVLLPTCN